MLVAKNLTDMITKLKENKNSKFNESIELAMQFISKKQPELIKKVLVMPFGIKKPFKIAVFSNSDEDLLLKLGATKVGVQSIINDIQEHGAHYYDIYLSKPEMMAKTELGSKIASIMPLLGKAGKAPDTKKNTITSNLPQVLKEIVNGQWNFIKTDRDGYIRLNIGKMDFQQQEIAENIRYIFQSLCQERVKNLTKCFMKSTMGPAIFFPKNLFVQNFS